MNSHFFTKRFFFSSSTFSICKLEYSLLGCKHNINQKIFYEKSLNKNRNFNQEK